MFARSFAKQVRKYLSFSGQQRLKDLKRHIRRGALAARIEPLEQRALLATFAVTTVDDDGAGSLRRAIVDANAAAGPNLIEFKLLGTGVHTINLTSPLPTITEQVTIDGSTQMGFLNQPLIEINGAAVVGNGFTIAASGSEIRGLAINRFQGNGILIVGPAATGNRIVGNFIGTNAAGTVDLGNAANGIQILDADNNTIGGLTAADRNIISGNNERGIRIEASGTIVVGNFIGTDASGSADLGNTTMGINVLRGSNNVIGGSSVAARNLISGNDADGIRIEGIQSTDNIVRANYIGTDATGMLAVPNRQSGVALFWDTVRNWVGGYGQFDGNVISSNREYGISMGVSSHNFIATNIIGLAADGDTPLPNLSHGISIFRGQNNEIGGIFGGNVISSNGGSGILVYFEATDVRIYGNHIGLNWNGNQDRGNGGHGVHLDQVAGNQVGGVSMFQGNKISGNQGSGVVISGSAASGNRVEGNFIGTDAAGMSAIGNSQAGVHIHSGAQGNIVGSGSSVRGVISGNGWDGVRIEGAGTTNNILRGLYVGTDQNGVQAIPNALAGVSLRSGSTHTTLGGAAGPALGNLISGNTLDGIEILSSHDNTIANNTIGLQANGDTPRPNLRHGISVSAGQRTTIGTANSRNVISANTASGIYVFGASREITIVGNFIGLDRTGQLARGNRSYGVWLDNVAANRIGGPLAGERNIISANVSRSISISGATATNNRVQNNFIGTNSSGTHAMTSTAIGVAIIDATSNIIGTDGDGNGDGMEGNLISGQAVGVRLIGASQNVVAGNLMGTNASGMSAIVPNAVSSPAATGIIMENSSNNNRIGTNADGVSDAAESNVIAGLNGSGIQIVASSNNSIAGNRIGIAADGSPLSNGSYGIVITGQQNVIGTSHTANVDPTKSNTIASNNREGVFITATGFRNTIRGNSIVNNSGLGIDLNPVGRGVNDSLDGDLGPNGLLNYPVLHTVSPGSVSQVSGALHSAPLSTFILDFYANSQSDAIRQGEGQRWLGSHQVMTDVSGNAIFTAQLGSLGLDEYVSSTSTDSLGNTSEFSRKMRRDELAPTSHVVPLSSPAGSLNFQISVEGSDPDTLSDTASGLKEFRIFVSTDGSAFLPWAVVPASTPWANFAAQSNRTYAFRSLAVDWAGNVESKAISVEASVYVPDLEPPTTEVSSVNSSQRLFQIAMIGIDGGGSGLREFRLELQIDEGPFQPVATVAAQPDQAGTLYSGSTSYQALADGQLHTYRFRSIGVDRRGNEESPPEEADVFVTAVFDPPVSLAISDFDVQNGATQRSLIQTLDVTFNTSTGVQNMLNTLDDDNITNDRIRLRRFNLDGSGSGDRVLINGQLSFSAVDSVMQLDFGPAGITGDPLTLQGNGYYALEFDLDGDGLVDSVKRFYRLLGDANGDRIVNALDNTQVSRRVGTSGSNLNEDLNADGVVTLVDVLAVRRGIGRAFANHLTIDD